MTLAAPRSRQGRLLLVLAFLAATVAIVGTFVWASNAQANVPNGTTVQVTDNSGTGNATGNAVPGTIITYTITIGGITGTPAATGSPVFEIQADPDLWPVQFLDNGGGNGPWNAADCGIVAGLQNDVKCTSGGATWSNDVITINYEVIPTLDNHIGPPNVFCQAYDGGSNATNCTFPNGSNSLDTDIGDYTITPKTAEDNPGDNHLITINLPIGFTCQSDATTYASVRQCNASDVSFFPLGSATVVNSPTVNATGAHNVAGTASFTITRPTVGNTRVTLDLKYVTGLNSNNFAANQVSFDVQVDPQAYKQWVVFSQASNTLDCGVITGTATSATGTTLTDSSANFPTGVSANLAGFQITITGGTGNIDPTTLAPQVRTITSNTSTTVTVSPAWAVNPANGSTYSISGGPCLRHVDLPDLGTEDAADPTLHQEQQQYCNNFLAGPNNPNPPIFAGVCGVLKGQDDIDDAQGSFHGACILDSLLTNLVNQNDITWHISAIVVNSVTLSPVAQTPFAGPNGEPCVMWGSLGPGTQHITAVYHEGQPDARTFYWDDLTKAPLVKEWNTIDDTRIVGTTGEVGGAGSLPSTISDNTAGAADWVNRDCSMIPLVPTPGGGDCALANLDSLTMPVEATFILAPNNGSFIRAPGHTFIDYTMGQHSDAGGAYNGPVDGASQKYTISGDCGSIRLENPTTGNIDIIAVSEPPLPDLDQPFPDHETILSSDKGVAFEFLPNDTGDTATTVNNADCGPGATICVTIDTYNEANQFGSPPQAIQITEKICVQYNVGPPTNKTPILAWAGQRVVLENYWGDPTGVPLCPGFNGTATGGGNVIGYSSLSDATANFVTGNPCPNLFLRTVRLTGGPGAGQTGIIVTNDNTSLLILDSVTFLPLATPPGAGTVYSIDPISNFHPCAEDDGGPVPDAAIQQHGNDFRFGVQYSIQAGSGSFTGAPLGNAHDIDQTGHDAIVHVSTFPRDDNGDGITDPNSNCTSRIVVESEDQTEMDVTSYIVNDNDNVGNATPRSQQVAFVVYFMKFESEQLQLIPDSNTATDTWDNGGTPTTGPVTVTVSDNVAAQVQVKGWVLTDNCPAHAAKTATGNGDGQAGEFFPANRCIFPDDWAFKAGALSQTPLCTGATAPVPQQCRPEFDIARTTPYACPGGSTAFVAGPFSMLDQITQTGLPVTCGDSLAPYPPANAFNPPGFTSNCLQLFMSYNCRESNFPDGMVTPVDAPMPPALVQFDLTGAGFLTGIGKAAAALSFTANDPATGAPTSYPDGGFNSAAIPAEPWISQINADGEGYVWNTWGAGANNGLFQYWTSIAAHGPEVISCAANSSGMFVNPLNPSANPCVNDPTPLAPCAGAPGIGVDCVRTGGYDMTEVYSDEHGMAATLINGDANLTFSGCSTSAPVAGTHTVVLLKGFYCANGATVGTSTLLSVVDYPDKRKHFAELTNTDTITWTWNGIKDVSVVPDPADTTGQFWYVVFHVTDRDGFCGSSDSLHPVLGEEVDFRIDSTTGTISPDVNGNSAEGPAASVAADLKSAVTHTFDTSPPDTSVQNGGIVVEPVMVTGECQAWIHVSESLHNQVNVIVTAFDPEGTVTFDTKDINPTPVPTPVPTAVPTASPSPTPVPTQSNLWADVDCNGHVGPPDSLKVLQFDAGQVPGKGANCPAAGASVDVWQDANHWVLKWGDADCNGSVNQVDSLKILQFDAGYTPQQQGLCPAIGSVVQIPVQP